MPVIPNTISILHEIAEERRRQVEAGGYTPDHDDLHDRGELAYAAASHALTAAAYAAPGEQHMRMALDTAAELWPFDRRAETVKPQRRHLIIAATLIVAEIERLERAANERLGRSGAA